MIRINKNQLPIRPPFYYGWVIVIVGAMGLFFSIPGQTYSISVFIDSYIEESGWSRSFVSTVYSFASILAGLLMFFVGRFVDRFGQRNMTVFVSLMLGLACLISSISMNPIIIFVGFLMLRLFGQGAMTLIPQTLIPQWFVKKRGRAISFISIGSFLGAAALPPFNAWIIHTWGMSIAWLFWFFMLCFFFTPIAFIFIRNRPEDVGLTLDNRIIEKPHKSLPNPGQRLVHEEEDWTLKEAFRTPVFWFVLFGMGVLSTISTGITFHLVSILGDNGIDRTTAAYVLSVMSIASFISTIICGLIVERLEPRYLLSITFLGMFGMMWMLNFVDSYTSAFIFGIFKGIIVSSVIVSHGVIIPNYFGRQHLGSIQGITMTVTVLASALGPLPFGITYDYFGGYTEIIMAMSAFPLIAVVTSFLAVKPSLKRDPGQIAK